MINQIAQVASFVLLLGGTFTFGLLGRPAEMSLCTVAAAIGLAFANIERIESFKGGGFEVKTLRMQVQALIAKEAEPEPASETASLHLRAYGLHEKTRKVVLALGNSKYTWRTVGGIAQETGLSLAEVRAALEWLEKNDLVVEAGKGKSANWGLSEEGRKLFNSIASAGNAA